VECCYGGGGDSGPCGCVDAALSRGGNSGDNLI
jgi:hypothetical protein